MYVRRHSGVCARSLTYPRPSHGRQVCHGLRNPLHAAFGVLDAVRAGDFGPGVSAGTTPAVDLNTLDVELQKMRTVLDAVVDAQQIEAGRTGVVLGPTDLQAIVRDVCQYHRSALRDGVELAVSVAADVPKITTDAPRVWQVSLRF
jgi:signal transduction histidine kinase